MWQLTILGPLLYCWLFNFVFGIYIRRLVQMTCSSTVLPYSRLPTNLSYCRLLCLPQYPNSFRGHFTAIISLNGNWIICVYPVIWSRSIVLSTRLIFDNIDKWMIKRRCGCTENKTYWKYDLYITVRLCVRKEHLLDSWNTTGKKAVSLARVQVVELASIRPFNNQEWIYRTTNIWHKFRQNPGPCYFRVWDF